ncbi:replication-relaxation family protein [Streptomyces sp. NBC_01728]|uniref:replication-relaxation family protein n=1 Tax=unclassified Streptomyces TaxID=2593676 RepID=UPI0022500953|nr:MULTISPECIES: replication-relaxation family protein [unclassified Streptomyces]MCX4462502.1 replication-relaxation family protein [Streptomyces sp. NBC_01719]MCX4490062.1 replication-relaxation family protein [Streptomyces sp. NBC_01728]MCX4499469.1 replication-relaxation family protein [Streptomyces sp. NBC_01728]
MSSNPEPLRHQALAALAQHRIATSSQLRQMLCPHSTRQVMSRVLSKLRTEGFIDCTTLPEATRSHTKAWYLTPDGARLTRNLPALRGRQPYPITSNTAASLKASHTLAVVRAHLAFAEDARRLGHEHGPWDWTPEVSHSIGEGERVVADAVMYYTVAESENRRKLRAFVEVDRTTMSSERLAVKLIEYARLFQYETQPVGRRRQAAAGPAWLRWYPVFPRVLFVLTGASRSRLENRMSDLQAMVAQHPLVAALAREVRLGAAVLEDIEQHGPAQAVWVPLTGGKPRPWTDL